MAISYNRLWKLEIAYRQKDEQGRPSQSLRGSLNTKTKLRRDESAILNVLDKICYTLNVNFRDSMDYVPARERSYS